MFILSLNFQFHVLGLEAAYNLLRNIHICSSCSKAFVSFVLLMGMYDLKGLETTALGTCFFQYGLWDQQQQDHLETQCLRPHLDLLIRNRHFDKLPGAQ